MRTRNVKTLRGRSSRFSLWTGLVALTFAIHAPAQEFVNAQLLWHAPVLDGQRKLLAWYEPEKNLGYGHVARLAWDFIEHKVPNDTRTHTDLKIYLINAVFDGQTLQGTNWQGNPASTFGQFVDSLVSWYPYSRDEEAIGVVRSMLDHQLAHGTTPADWKWPRVPFATTCDDDPEYGGCLRGMPKDYHDQYWFDDGYGDYIRHFMWAMGAIPEFAPKGESHLLRSSSIVRKVTYGKQGIEYRTFDAASTEVARLNFKPARITAGGTALGEKPDLKAEGYTIKALADGDYVVRIRHAAATDIAISRE